ncbi:MAG: hypothetical protein CUN55_13935, partial [Phototrophicales bacterium]
NPILMEIVADTYYEYCVKQLPVPNSNKFVKIALHLYERILNEFPDYYNIGWIYYQIGTIFMRQAESQLALSHFHHALVSESRIATLTAFCYEQLGRFAFYEERNFHKALSFLRRAMMVYPHNYPKLWLANLYLLSSRVIFSLRQYDAALGEIQQAIEIAGQLVSKHKQAHAILLDALFVAGQLTWQLRNRQQDTITYLKRFIQLKSEPSDIDVTWSRVHEMLGDAYYALGQFRSAIVAYRVAIQFNPFSPTAASMCYRVALSFYFVGDYVNVIAVINEMIAIHGKDVEIIPSYRVYDTLGAAYFALEEYALAATAYRQALDFEPENTNDIEKMTRYYRYSLTLMNI